MAIKEIFSALCQYFIEHCKLTGQLLQYIEGVPPLIYRGVPRRSNGCLSHWLHPKPLPFCIVEASFVFINDVMYLDDVVTPIAIDVIILVVGFVVRC